MKVNAACQQSAVTVARATWRDRLRLVFLRGLAGATRPFVPGPRPLGRDPRILVIRPDHLGDLLFATPAFQALREAFPAGHITALVGPWTRDIVARNAYVDAVCTCSFPWFDRRPMPRPSAGHCVWVPYRLLWYEAAALRAQGFDAALNLRPDFWWGSALAALARIPTRVGYDVPACRPFLTTRVPHAGAVHDVERNLALVAALSERPDRSPDASLMEDNTTTELAQGSENAVVRPVRFSLSYEPTDEEHAWAADYLAGHDEVVAVAPGAGARCKQWTVEGWGQVITALTEDWGLRTVLVGGPAEADLCRAIAGQVTEPPLVAAGETTLGQLAALFGRCRLVVGIDSGPLNLAVTVGVPTVHLFGPADPVQFGPWGPPQQHAVVRGVLPCVPCRKLDWPLAGDEVTPCMAAIAPADVVAAVERVLEQEKPGF